MQRFKRDLLSVIPIICERFEELLALLADILGITLISPGIWPITRLLTARLQLTDESQNPSQIR